MDDSKWFLLVKGDVSGIQGFIFNVKSDGAARELKARSFFIKILIETSIQCLLDEFKVDIADYDQSKISTSGGNFILKLPFIEKYDVIINEVQQVFTKALDTTGLNISINAVPYNPDTDKYGDCLVKLNSNNRKAKYSFYAQDFSFFEPFDKSSFKSGWSKIYEMITGNNAFKIEKGGSSVLNLGSNIVELAGYKTIFNNLGEGRQLSEFLESLIPKQGNGSIKPFNILAASDKQPGNIRNGDCQIIINGGKDGIEKLGILAMDVDGLGAFLENVNNESQHKIIDDQLRCFFNDKLSEIINCQEITYFNERCKINVPLFQNKIYSVTAGGDDSFFVGKWNTILDFALEINKQFHAEFGNHNLTISAGLVIVDPKFPVVRFAEKVEHALSKAKYSYETKGNICILGEVIPWQFLPEIMKRRKVLSKSISSGKFTKGLLEKTRMTIQSVENFTSFRLEDFWKLSYFLRNMRPQNSKEVLNWVKDDIERSAKELSPLEKKVYRLRLPMAARLAEFDQR